MYKNFVRLTDALKDKGNRLIVMFNFPLTLPELYKPDIELMSTLEVMVNSLQEDVDTIGASEVEERKEQYE